jgi:hypothetical protein
LEEIKGFFGNRITFKGLAAPVFKHDSAGLLSMESAEGKEGVLETNVALLMT